MLLTVLFVLGGIFGAIVGALFIGREMADDFVDDWSEFRQFIAGVGCYALWAICGGAFGALTGPVSFPIIILAGPVYLIHRWYFNRKKVDY